MYSAKYPDWRLPVRWFASAFALALVLAVFPPFHVRPLASGVATGAAPGAVDVPRMAEEFWTERLTSPAVQPVDLRTLVTAIRQDPAGATKQYGHRVGIGGSAYFFVGGETRVSALEHTGVWLATDVPNSIRVVLITGPVFGNALRDATGLLHIDDFKSFDFNALGAELNRIAETRAQPALRKGMNVGMQISFLAAGEIDDASGEEPVLELIPIRVTSKP